MWNGLKTTATTVFNGIKTTIATIWSNVQTNSSTTWNNIKTTLSTLWNGLKTTATTAFNNLKTEISKAWNNVKTETDRAWDNIKRGLGTAWDSIKRAASDSFEGIKNTIKGKWDEIVRSASSWGSDLCGSMARGIRGAVSTVTNAARSVAESVSGFLHFSEPDVGPLSNFHTFMPDMLQLMAKGITDNTYLATNAAYDLAERVSKTLNTGINPRMALEVDTSALRYYDSDRFAQAIAPDVEARFTADGFEGAMERFYREYLQPTMNQMAEDVRRQADKDVRPVVTLDGRVLNDSMNARQRANGYQFVK